MTGYVPDPVAHILSLVKIGFAPTILFGVMILAYWALPVGKIRIKTAVPGAHVPVDAPVIWRGKLHKYSRDKHIYVWKPCKYYSSGIVAVYVYVCDAHRCGTQQIHRQRITSQEKMLTNCRQWVYYH